MAPKGKGRNEDLKQEDVLQAVVIADSFNVRFGPVTRDKPRALLPLVNVPLLDYTLEALATSGVQEVFVVCCHLGDQVRGHIRQSKWQDCGSPMAVTAVMSDSCLSMGDALREIDSKALIRTDFILIMGDIVANMDIGQVVKEHKARTQGKDKSSVMTLVFRVAQPGHRARTKEENMFLIEQGDTGRLLYFKKTKDDSRKIAVPMDILMEHDDIIVHNDLMDCHISVCSPSVPTLFTDNFDYQTRDDFVKGILIDEEIMGNKIHINIVRDKFAARVSNMQTYDAISKDVICRWTLPYVPDIYGSGSGERVKYGPHNVYCSKDVTLARGCELKRDVVVGSGTRVGSGTDISRCVIGKNCHIGDNVTLHNSYLWDNVRVEDNCEVDTALLCSGVSVLSNVVLKRGVILAWNVVVGPNVTIAQGTQLMSEPQRDEFDDNDLSFGDDDAQQLQSVKEKQGENEEETEAESYGAQSKAFLFKPYVDSDDEDEAAVIECQWGKSASDSEERNSYESESESEEEEEDSEGEAMGDFDADSEEEEDVVDSALGFSPKACMMRRNTDFYQELVDTIVRGHTEKITDDNLILEINSLKHAYTVPIDEVIASLPCAMFEMGASLNNAKVTADSKLFVLFKKNVERYAPLLSKYIKNAETQLVAINGLGDFVIRNSELRPKLPQLINFLYDADVLSEGSILSWFNSNRFQPGSNDALRHEFLKKLVQPLVKWLQEAEEESSEEDDDDDDDE
ncbi:translation initiation factor eIF-2B subunit epsilon [Aplysia californica]|uniref:Translation initiation factor eIF2B subunit epsilon n=1 Tax=Aplysia californica TaxID=6500 RepID=A0ABM0JV12_APLCA|nr:translation initiation factor eIF-2B subunit epsilon [Aplysia californica]